MWNRTNSNFPKTQGPVARKKAQKATQILRAGNFLSGSRGNSRNRGPEKGDYEHEVLIRSRPRGRFAYFAAMGKVGRRPQAAKSPVRKEPSSGPMRASGPTKKRSIIAPSSVWPPASHLSLSPLAFGHLPLTRGVGPEGKALRGRPPRGRLIKNETGAPGRPFSRGRLIALIGDTSCWSDTGARR